MPDDRQLVAEALARPWSYAKQRLGFDLHPKQVGVLRDLYQPNSRVMFRCGNEVGKTSRVAVAAILHHAEVLKGLVVSTAGAYRQVAHQLVPNLQRQSHLYPGWRFLSDRIIDASGAERYLGFAAASQATFQGFHNIDGPLMIVLDESAAIADDIFWAAEERCNPTRLLIMGSPLDPAGMFYEYSTRLAAFYKQHRLGQLDCLKEDGYWLERATVQRKIDKWGPDHPIVLSSVYADFALSVDGSLLSLREWEACLEQVLEPHGRRRHAFLDFAAGGDENVLAVAQGNKVWIQAAWRERNTMAAIGEFVSHLNKLKREIGLRPEEVEGDADGMGIVFCQALAEAGWPILHFHGASEPLADGDFKNRISEVWTAGTNAIRKREWILPRDEELKAQVITRKSGRDSSGKLTIESKKELKKRGVPSPDRADAVLGAIGPLPMTSSIPQGSSEPRDHLQQAYEDMGGGHGLPGGC